MSMPLEISSVPVMEGAVAYPRKNGEPVFEAPWQSRAFGMAVQLHKSGLYPWDDFKTLLIEEVAAGGCAMTPSDSSEYYLQWVSAFLRLLVKNNIITEQEISERSKEFKVGVRQDVY